jgi:hypothetical protein
MASIGLAYTSQGGTSYNIVLDQFTGAEIPRIYDGSATFGRTASGGTTIASRAGSQKYIWGISTPVTKTKALQIDTMFQAWDDDRGAGYAAAIGVTDQTFGASVTASAVFSTPPSYTYSNDNYVVVSFGLSEV